MCSIVPHTDPLPAGLLECRRTRAFLFDAWTWSGPEDAARVTVIGRDATSATDRHGGKSTRDRFDDHSVT
jgi:hypothetical protein